MKKVSKKLLSIFMAAAMVVSLIPMGAFVAEATTSWNVIASSDFRNVTIGSGTQDGDRNRESLGYLPTYNGGNAISWARDDYTGWGRPNATHDGTDNALSIPDGYIFINGYSGGSVPITGTRRWKIDLGFRFNGTNSNNYYDSDKKFGFLKMFVYTDNLKDPPRDGQGSATTLYGYCYFGQDANGLCYSWEQDHSVGTKSQNTSICTGSSNLSSGVNYRYVAEFTGTRFRAYITDDNHTIIQDIVNTTEETFISRLNNISTNTITSMKIGDDNNADFYRDLVYRDITFYEGTAVADASTAAHPSNSSDKYVMAYFTGNNNLENESIRYAVSVDGINYHALNKGMPVAKINNPTGLTIYPSGTATGADATGHIRDPYILRKQDGSGFYVLATDLDTGANGFNNNSKMLVWELTRLEDISTTTPWVIDVRSMMQPIFGNNSQGEPHWIHRAWAPEAFYDSAKGKYFMHFSVRANDAADSGTYLYGVYTSNFKSFDTTPKRLINTGADNIDASINYNSADDLYYMWYKNESNSKLNYAIATNAEGPYVNVSSFDYNKAVEGPEIFKNLANNGWIFLCDAFGESADPATSKQGVFQAFTSSSISGFDTGSPVSTNIKYLYARHAGVARVTNAEYEALIAAYGGMVSNDKVEYFFTGNTSWSGNGWLGSVNDPSEQVFKIMGDSSASYASHIETINGEDDGVLTLTNCNAFFQDNNVRNLLKGDSYTVNFKVKITDASKLNSDIPVAAISNINSDFIKATTSGKFYLDGQVVEGAYSLAANTEYEFTISYNGTTASLFIDGEYVAGLVQEEAVVDPSDSAQCYLSFGWSDQCGTSRISAKYRDLTIDGTHLDTSAYDAEIMEEYIENNASASVSDVASHITAYESRMNGTVYKNMANAYNAYVKVNRMLDAYNYANDNETKIHAYLKLLEADAELTAANSAMTAWSAVASTGSALWGSNVMSSDFWSNVLYSDGGRSWTKDQKSGNYSCQGIAPSNVVLLKDGITAPSFPVKMKVWRSRSSTQSHGPYMVNTSGLKLQAAWQWGDTNEETTSGFYDWDNPDIPYQTGVSTPSINHSSARYYVNRMYLDTSAYSAELTNDASCYNKVTDDIHFICYNNGSAMSELKMSDNNSISNVYVVNYEQLISSINNSSNKSPLNGVASYKEGGLSTLLTAYDRATSYNPNSYFTSATSSNCATCVYNANKEILDTVNALSSGNSSKTSDYDYSTLRSRFDSYKNSSLTDFTALNAKQLIASPDVNATTVENYDAFVTAYNAAANHMEGLMSDTYHYASASTLATNLKNAIDDLVIIDRSAFNSKVTEANEIINTLALSTQAYTTTSIVNLRDTLLPAYQSACLAATSNSAVATQTTNLINAIGNLAALANFAALDSAYALGDAKLKELSNETPKYTTASVDALITAVGDAKDHATMSSASKLDTSAKDVQELLDDEADAISDAIEALEAAVPAAVTDISAYEAAVEKFESIMNNIDSDIYETTAFTPANAATEIGEAGDSTSYSVGGNTYTIYTIDNSANQSKIESAATSIASYITSSYKQYKIYVEEGSFTVTADAKLTGGISSESGTDEHGTYYYKGYANTSILATATEDTAWYMSYTSTGTGRDKQYQGYGRTFSNPLIGDMHIYAVQRTNETPNKVTIRRHYSDNSTSPTQCVDFVDGSYTVPTAPAIPFYTFTGYTYGGNTYGTTNDNKTISGITDDIVIIANYEKAATNEYTVKVSSVSGNRDIFNDSAEYNQMITVSDPSAAGWVINPNTANEKLFYVGSSFTFYVCESVEIKGIASLGSYTTPNVNLSPAVTSGGKTAIVGQVVGNDVSIVEYGILVGKSKNGSTLGENDLILKNTGNHDDYSILRAKATKLVGANQFSIGVTGMPAGTYQYRSYLVYEDENELITVYSDVLSTTVA